MLAAAALAYANSADAKLRKRAVSEMAATESLLILQGVRTIRNQTAAQKGSNAGMI